MTGFLITFFFFFNSLLLFPQLAFKTLPYRADFIKKLAVNSEDITAPNFDQIVSEDMANYNKGLENILQILKDFYTQQGLNN